MSLLVLISVICCGGLLMLGGLLWVAVQRRPGRQSASAVFQPVGSVKSAMASVPSPLFLHPRMDLASGSVPGNQTVDLDRRRNRRQIGEELGFVAVESGGGTQAFEPFGERQRLARTFKQRLDLVYAREAMGDLSDPDAATGRQYRHQA